MERGLNPLHLYALYEYGKDLKPYGSSQIRILRPFSHPSIIKNINLSSGIEYYGEQVDAVILDRLWRPEVSLNFAYSLVNDIKRVNTPFIYAIDDNLLDLHGERIDWDITHEKEKIVEFFLKQADLVIVTTPYLKERFSAYNQNIQIIPNMLDDRLLCNRTTSSGINKNEVITIGYMGTFTHDADLLLVLPAIKMILERYKGHVKFQLLGVSGDEGTQHLLREIDCEILTIPSENVEYTKFMPWFTSSTNWDIAIAPLRDTLFTRAKSDIKFLDYCAIEAAGIFSNVVAYSQSVVNLKNGILVDDNPEEWYAAMVRLIEDVNLRKFIQINEVEYLNQQRLVTKNIEIFTNPIYNTINTKV
jgi:glycosyltransferase involved in cell wall biosynthesis